ncbi:cadherin-like domain-containing protein [Gammaproteobacteria bacterium]|jgi:hypothetical protein|nr:cadherin-like domain-containing protein [Gammaproteobacteria bacterium]
MRKLYFLSIIFVISSCGGGGGGGGAAAPVSIPFSLTLGLTSFSVNEDETYSGTIKASANETVTLQYTITNEPSQGSLNLSTNGDITYKPSANYNGPDQFQYSVTAVEKSVTKNATVNITVSPVDDIPSIIFEGVNSFSKDVMMFETQKTFRVLVSDEDTDIENLTFSILIGEQTIAADFTLDTGENSNGSGDLLVDLSTLDVAGLFDANLQVSDSTSTNSVSFTSWFISNKSTVTIQQDNDPDDGFDGGEKTPKDYLVYYLSGSPDSIGKTKYLFIGDSLDGETDIDLYRIALISSMNKLNDSDASDFFNPNYFTVISAEPINPDGTSPVGVRTGCYDYDEDIYCIGEMDVDIFDVLLPDNTLVSTLTRVQGRGVNLGYRNIQKIRDTEPERTSNTLMHELGHAHGYMGDEYRSDDDRDVSEYADLNVNTSTQSDVAFLKWNHHIEDQLNVLGRDIKVCYNTADGRIYDRDADEYVEGADCNCLANEWDSNGNFVRKNPECGKVGQFEGNYYGEFDNYRPTFCSIMDSCTSGGYGKVNVEGFAVGSLQNQGFYDDSNRGFVQNSNNENSGWQIVLDAAYDTSKVTLKWFVNGVEDTSKENQTDVIFNRPSNNGIAIYTAKAIDLTGTITATDDVTNHDDFYKGLFQTSFYWCAGYIQNDSCEWSYDPDPSRYSEFDYGYMNGPLGVTWGINWDKW